MASEEDRKAYESARRHLDNRQFDEAFAQYSRLAEAGDPRSQVFVGWMCSEGWGTTKDPERALEWYRKAASVGSPAGAYYCAGHAIRERSYEEALKWLYMAAANEYGPALLWLGILHVRGMGVATDRAKGIKYLERAAATGNFLARRHLGLMMVRGEFGPLRVIAGLILFPYWAILALVEALSNGYSDKFMG